MARYVVLSFEDNEDAEAFISDTLTSDAIHETGIEVKVEAVMAKPTQFCDGECYKEKDGRGPKFTQGKKYGWWVCLICHKPLPHPALYRPVVAYGTNLIAEEVVGEGIEEREGGLMPFDPGWGRYRGQRLSPSEAERLREPYVRGTRRYGRFAFELSLT